MGLDLVLIAAGAAGVLVGALLLVLGIRGRRLDDHPACRRCGFDLLGLDLAVDGARCPECGRSVGSGSRRAVRIGRRKRLRAAIAIGVLLVVLVGAPAGTMGWLLRSGANLDHCKPVWMLIMEAGSARQGTSSGARAELRRRMVEDEISRSGARAVAAEALARQAGPDEGWDAGWGTLFELAWVGGWLDAEMVGQYEQQALRVRAVSRGEPRDDGSVTVELELDDRTGDIVMIRVKGRVTVPEGGGLRATSEGEFNLAGMMGQGSVAVIPPIGVTRKDHFAALGISAVEGAGSQSGRMIAFTSLYQFDTPVPARVRLAPLPSEGFDVAEERNRQRLLVVSDVNSLRLNMALWTGAWTGPSYNNTGFSTWWSRWRVEVVATPTWRPQEVRSELVVEQRR